MMTKGFVLAAGLGLAALTAPAFAADYETGKKLFTEKNCVSCHGEQGNKPVTPETPKLAGQYADYVEQALAAYQTGKRQNPMMSPMVQGLTKAEMRNIAYFISKQEGLVKKY